MDCRTPSKVSLKRSPANVASLIAADAVVGSATAKGSGDNNVEVDTRSLSGSNNVDNRPNKFQKVANDATQNQAAAPDGQGVGAVPTQTTTHATGSTLNKPSGGTPPAILQHCRDPFTGRRGHFEQDDPADSQSTLKWIESPSDLSDC